MKYMGSKSRVASSLVPVIQSYISTDTLAYIEPFCGGCNVIDKIQASQRVALDNNKYLIALWKHLQEHENPALPVSVSHDAYSDVRSHKDNYDDWLVGAVGFLASYNGRFFDGGYAGVTVTKTGVVRDYYDEAKRNVLTQRSSLKDVVFACSDYTELQCYDCVVYCDPPYAGVKQYATSKHFDSTAFWDWVRYMSKDNIVLVSEHSAPDDFEVVWQQTVTRTQNNRARSRATEKLFKLRKEVAQ